MSKEQVPMREIRRDKWQKHDWLEVGHGTIS